MVCGRTPRCTLATDRTENAVLCTVPVDQGVEAVFYLDSLTGWIRGAVPSRQVEGAFQATWQHNVNVDLTAFVTRMNAGIKSAGKAAGRPEMQLPQNPKYMVTSGLIDYPTRATLRPASSVLYVAEASAGVVLCYAIPWEFLGPYLEPAMGRRSEALVVRNLRHGHRPQR